MQHIASQWSLQLIFRMHNSDPTPQGVENRNILPSFKCVLIKIYIEILSTSTLRSRSVITTLQHY
jgi:hypothetical protein